MTHSTSQWVPGNGFPLLRVAIQTPSTMAALEIRNSGLAVFAIGVVAGALLWDALTAK